MMMKKRSLIWLAMGLVAIVGFAVAATLSPDPKTILTALNSETGDYEGFDTVSVQSTVTDRQYVLYASPDWTHPGNHAIYWVDMWTQGSDWADYNDPLEFTGNGGTKEVTLVVGSPYTDAWLDLELWQYVQREGEWIWEFVDDSEVRALNQ